MPKIRKIETPTNSVTMELYEFLATRSNIPLARVYDMTEEELRAKVEEVQQKRAA